MLLARRPRQAGQLGSTSTVLSAAGAVEESQAYYPYGAPRSGGITLTDKQFTGQQEEPAMLSRREQQTRSGLLLVGRASLLSGGFLCALDCRCRCLDRLGRRLADRVRGVATRSPAAPHRVTSPLDFRPASAIILLRFDIACPSSFGSTQATLRLETQR
jgi:hypothetical protein